MELHLRDRKIPRNTEGDPDFCCLDQDHADDKKCDCTQDDNRLCVNEVFSPEEVVEIVNRYLYHATYQKEYHKKSQARQLALNKLLNATLRDMFGITQAKATPQQIQQAVERMAKEVTQ